MGEDKLSRAQRVRLEAFNQAAQVMAMTPHLKGLKDHIGVAEQIEQFLWRADIDLAERTVLARRTEIHLVGDPEPHPRADEDWHRPSLTPGNAEG